MFVIEFNSDTYISILESSGIATIHASVKKIPKIELEEFGDFLKLVEVYSIKAVLAEIYYYDESDFDLLTLDDIDEKYKVKDIENQINGFNYRLQSLRHLIGKEEFVDLYFNYQGLLYNYSWSNDALDEANADFFLEYLDHQYTNEIEANEEKQRNKHISKRNDYIKKLKEYIRNDKSFLICTNQDLRRSYANKLLENEELQPPEEIPVYRIVSLVNETWSEMRNALKSM